MKTRASKKKTYDAIQNSSREIADIQHSSCGAAYTVECHRYTHTNSPDFHWLVVTVQGIDGN